MTIYFTYCKWLKVKWNDGKNGNTFVKLQHFDNVRFQYTGNNMVKIVDGTTIVKEIPRERLYSIEYAELNLDCEEETL